MEAKGTGPVDGKKQNKTNTAVFPLSLVLLVANRRLKVAKTRPWVIFQLCRAVCISDVMNKVGMCGKGIKCDMRQVFFLLSFGEDRTNMSAPRGAKIGSKKVLLFIKLLTEESNKASRRKYLHSLYVLTPAVTSSFRFPLWLSSGVSLRKPGVGQNAYLHALPTVRNSDCKFCLHGTFNFFFVILLQT